MTKQEFLQELRENLSGEVSSEAMLDAYRYYDTYIEDEIRSGKTEEAVIEALGRPALIARSIISANSGQRVADEEYTEDGRVHKVSNREKRRQAAKEEREETVHKEFVFDFTAWYAKVLFILILLLVIALVFCIIKGLFWFMIRFAIPILIILGIVYLILYFIR